jgi:integrase
VARKKADPGKMVKTSVPGIYKRNGAYIVRVYDPETKKRHNYPAPTFDKAKDIKRNAESGKRLKKRTGQAAMTVRQWAGDKDIEGQWLKLFPRPAESTMLHNRERVKQFVHDFGDRLLSGVSPVEAAEWAIDNPYRVIVVKAMFNDAIKLQLIEESPFSHVEGPSKQSRDIIVLTDEELLLLMASASRKLHEYGQKVFQWMILFAAWTGMRPGELFMLDGDNIDFEQGIVQVKTQWNSKLAKETDTKSHRPREVVLLPQAERAAKHLPLEPGYPAFPAIRGQRMTGRVLGDYWRQVRGAFVDQLPERHDLRRREALGDFMDFYELRHRFGTELAHLGCSQYEIADQMGHSDNGATALKHYIKTDKRRLADNVRERVRRAA